jgi:cytoskeletal protein RodZ
MASSQYVRYGVLSGLLLLYTILVLSTIGDNHNLVFAQITPAPGKTANVDSSPNSSTNNDDDGSTSSSDKRGATLTEQDITTEEDKNNDGHGEGITPAQQGNTKEDTEDQGAKLTEPDQTAEEQDIEHEQTNPLAEAIMNKVNKILSASGITGPAF